MEIFEQLAAVVEAAREDADKFYNKGTKAAGTRLRKAMQELKKLAQDLRLDVSEKNKQ